MDLRRLRSITLCWARRLLLLMGGLGTIMLVVAFTRIPFHAHRWLGMAGGLAGPEVHAIVVLSGSGMPSGPELMRCHEAAFRARLAPQATILLLLPADTTLERAMVEELMTRGVPRTRIAALLHGRNTREQALDLATAFPQWKEEPIALVTSPEHAYRSLRTFRKLGFGRMAGAPAFDHALFTDLRYSHQGIGGKPFLPDMAGHAGLRYNFWNYLKLEITCLREYAALAYYKVNGWI